ncbi:hypothetical protein KI387_042437, partial [Taxus chinensis]
DMFDSEYYVGAFQDGSTWRTNKYADVASVEMPSDSKVVVWDRRLLYCIPVPGQNAWVRDASCKGNDCSDSIRAQQREKRGREISDPTEDTDMMNAESELSNESKRKREEGSSSRSSAMETCQRQSNRIEFDPNMPLGQSHMLPCLVKIYDGMDGDLKLNDIVEFIGVFTFDPDLSSPSNEQDAMAGTFIDDDVSSHLPASKVPRLHCIITRKLSTNSLVSSFINSEVHFTLQLKELRESLLQSLKAVFGGDDLAAQYFLLHILSQIHARVEPVALGRFSMNLTRVERGSNVHLFIKNLNEAIQDLVPCSHLLPLTIEYLNGSSVAPKKNYQTNRLSTGALQLASGTHLTIDETQLKAGTLNSTGVQNVQIFRNLLEWQKVAYDFEYYTMDMATDVQVLILSDGKSNIFPADIVVPYTPTSDSSPLSASQLDKQQWRLYLSTMKSYEHTIEAAIQQVVENDMVTARQQDRSIGPEVFSRWLTMARLVSLSFGEKTLTLDHWQMVKDLERAES